MNAEQHAFYARRLVSACGGPKLAATICRVSEAQLSRYGQAHHPDFMPTDVLFALESDCGDKAYSRALFDGPPVTVGELFDDACSTVEDAAALQADVHAWRKACRPMTAAQRQELRARCVRVRDDVERAIADIDAVPERPRAVA